VKKAAPIRSDPALSRALVRRLSTHTADPGDGNRGGQADVSGSGVPAAVLAGDREREGVHRFTLRAALAELAAGVGPEFSSIFSVYFTDVVPLSRLLPEIWRLLEVGGTFVHVGPLGYHFDDVNEHLSAEALIERFRAAGFEVSAPRWLTTTHYAARESLYHAHVDNMAFTARKSGAVLQREHPRPPFVR
jgi:hypothetical protein